MVVTRAELIAALTIVERESGGGKGGRDGRGASEWGLPGRRQPCQKAFREVLHTSGIPNMRLHEIDVVMDCVNEFHMLPFSLPCFSNDLFVHVECRHESCA